jgi:hypothetical protein
MVKWRGHALGQIDGVATRLHRGGLVKKLQGLGVMAL